MAGAQLCSDHDGEPFSAVSHEAKSRACVWVTSIAAAILPSHVRDQRFGLLRLDFKRGGERVFGVDHHMSGFAVQLQSDSE